MSCTRYISVLLLLYFQLCYINLVSGKILPAEKYVHENNNVDKDEIARIVNGMPARDGQFPYAVALHYNNQYICTGSIISNDTILTAAHCVVMNGNQEPASVFSAVVGSADRTVKNDNVVKFNRIQVHPAYQPKNLSNDIALLKMSEPIKFNDKVKAICLAPSNSELYEYKDVTVMGWGKSNQASNSTEVVLRYTTNVVCSTEKCAQHFGARGVNITNKQMCANGLASGICDGDSGGPAIYEANKEKPIQVGVNSFILDQPGCGSPFSPAVLTRVSAYRDWIATNANMNPEDYCK